MVEEETRGPARALLRAVAVRAHLVGLPAAVVSQEAEEEDQEARLVASSGMVDLDVVVAVEAAAVGRLVEVLGTTRTGEGSAAPFGWISDLGEITGGWNSSPRQRLSKPGAREP